MAKVTRQIGTIILQIALALVFIVGGIWTLQSGNGDEVSSAIHYIFSSDIAKVVCIVFSILEIIAGAFLIIRLFVSINTVFDSVLMIIILICWITAIIVVDFVGCRNVFDDFSRSFLPYLNKLARHLLVLGAIIKVKNI